MNIKIQIQRLAVKFRIPTMLRIQRINVRKAILLSALVLAGCQHPKHRIGDCTPSATLECADVLGPDRHAKLFKKPAPSAEKFAYGASVGRAIRTNLHDPQNYAGKACTIRLKIAPTGLLLAAQTEGGDPAYCAALLSAARATTFTVPPAGATDANHAILPLDFTETAPRVTELNEGL